MSVAIAIVKKGALRLGRAGTCAQPPPDVDCAPVDTHVCELVSHAKPLWQSLVAWQCDWHASFAHVYGEHETEPAPVTASDVPSDEHVPASGTQRPSSHHALLAQSVVSLHRVRQALPSALHA
jgi:hypothetical protein